VITVSHTGGCLNRTSITAAGVVFIAPVVARQADLCSLLTYILLTFCKSGSDQHGVGPFQHPGFHTPSFTICWYYGIRRRNCQ
jgi:hypothetical protein